MTDKERKSCICTIKMLRNLALNVHEVMDVVDYENCEKMISLLESFKQTAQPSATDTDVATTDTISRAAAIALAEEIESKRLRGEIDFTYPPMIKGIKSLPSAQPTDAEIQRMQDIEQAALEKAYECGKQDAQQWIPCEERLPEPGVNVLVDVLDIPAGDHFPLVDKIWDDGEWCNCYGDWFAVAWMPIPEPYKEGEK